MNNRDLINSDNGRIITRKEYMGSLIGLGLDALPGRSKSDASFTLFREYYAQFVTPEIVDLVSRTFNPENLAAKYKGDRHLNNIPLGLWDRLVPSVYTLVSKQLLKDTGEGWSISTGVCIAKTAAQQIALASRD